MCALLVHAREYEQVEPAKEPWYTNLVSVGGGPEGEADELASLRQEVDKRRERQGREKRGVSQCKEGKKEKGLEGQRGEAGKEGEEANSLL